MERRQSLRRFRQADGKGIRQANEYFMKRPIEKKDQEPIARLIRSVFEEYGAPLVNTVYDDPRTWHIYEYK